MLTFSVAKNASAPAELLLQNEFSGGRLSKQIVTGGLTYYYTYKLSKYAVITKAAVSISDGRHFIVDVNLANSAIREVDGLPSSNPPRKPSL